MPHLRQFPPWLPCWRLPASARFLSTSPTLLQGNQWNRGPGRPYRSQEEINREARRRTEEFERRWGPRFERWQREGGAYADGARILERWIRRGYREYARQSERWRSIMRDPFPQSYDETKRMLPVAAVVATGAWWFVYGSSFLLLYTSLHTNMSIFRGMKRSVLSMRPRTPSTQSAQDKKKESAETILSAEYETKKTKRQKMGLPSSFETYKNEDQDADTLAIHNVLETPKSFMWRAFWTAVITMAGVRPAIDYYDRNIRNKMVRYTVSAGRKKSRVWQWIEDIMRRVAKTPTWKFFVTQRLARVARVDWVKMVRSEEVIRWCKTLGPPVLIFLVPTMWLLAGHR